MIQSTSGGRYTKHDLLRAYAADLAAAGVPTRAGVPGVGECRVSLERLLDHYLATAAAARQQLQPAGAPHRSHGAHAATPIPALPDAKAEVAWLDIQRPGLVAATVYAARGWPGHAVRLATTLSQ